MAVVEWYDGNGDDTITMRLSLQTPDFRALRKSTDSTTDNEDAIFK